MLAIQGAREASPRRALAALNDYLVALLTALVEVRANDDPAYGHTPTQLNTAFEANLMVFPEFSRVIEANARYVEGDVETVLFEFFRDLVQLAQLEGAPTSDSRDFLRMFLREFYVLTVALLIRHRRYEETGRFLTRPYVYPDQTMMFNRVNISRGPADQDTPDWRRTLSRQVRQAIPFPDDEYAQAELLLFLHGGLRNEWSWSTDNGALWVSHRPRLFLEARTIDGAHAIRQVLGLQVPEIVRLLRSQDDNYALRHRLDWEHHLDLDALQHIPLEP